MTPFTEYIFDAAIPFLVGLLLLVAPQIFIRRKHQDSKTLKLFRFIGLGLILIAIFWFIIQVVSNK